MKHAQEALISLGSNVPQGRENIAMALRWLRTFMTDVADSGIYTSDALSGNGSYFNAVVKGFMTLNAQDFEILAKEKETQAGRVRPSEKVALDIDLVRLGSSIIRPAELCRLYFLQGCKALNL